MATNRLSETQKSRVNHVTILAALSLIVIHNLMRLISPLRISIECSNINENYGTFQIIFESKLMFIGLHDFRGIRIKMMELRHDKASKDCFNLYTIAEMISMAEIGTRTITLTKGLGCLMK